jgi:hypothetical protein
MNDLALWQQSLTGSWEQVWGSFLSFTPNILGAIIVFTIGLVLAYWAKKITTQILARTGIERFSKTSGVESYLKRADIKLSLTDIISVFVEWLIILVFFLAVVDILGLTAVSTVLTRVLSYVPNIVAAAFIFVAGYILAGVLGAIVRGAVASVDPKLAKPVGSAARWLVLIVSFFAAIDQLQIAQNLIASFFQGLSYTIVLAVGLSVGLGAKDLVANILNDWYQKNKR